MSDLSEGLSSAAMASLHGVDVTLVLPCLNEELAIAQCVQHAREVMELAGLAGTVLVVDNGSTDRSVEIALAAGAHVVHQPEPGYGAALRSGFENATTTYVIMADADGTYEFAAIPRLLQPLIDDRADLVMGSRLDDATLATMPWLHRFVGTPAISMLVNHAAGGRIKIRDSQSGFRAFRREQLLELQLNSTGMEFASEMLIRCAWANFRITEVKTNYSERIGESKLNTFSDGLRHLRQILLLSPDAFALVPGLLMTGAAFILWGAAATSVHGLGLVGSDSWLANITAGVLSVIGPITFCVGLVLRYRAESLGYRHEHIRIPLGTLIRRFFVTGVVLIIIAIALIVVLVANYHSSWGTLSESASTAVGSYTRSSLVVGITLVAAPLLSPFLIHPPRTQLPPPTDED
jgi:hypothetical protein